MKSVAIMQPYFFPYLGYFQLIHSVDLFVCFDDVNFIKKGWIHRNQIVVNGGSHLFTVPLTRASQNRKINQIELDEFYKWRTVFLKMIRLNYSKCPQFDVVFNWLETCLNRDFDKISELNYLTILEVLKFLDIDSRKVVRSSSIYNNSDLVGQDRILDICLQEGASRYINAYGGRELYQNEFFQEQNIELRFLKTGKIIYPQKSDIFVPYMSILDLLFNVPKHDVNGMLNKYDLLTP
jgi:hypothetical protein